ncbi:MAG: Ion transport protein [Rhodobacterales bacterium]|nr:MAG: Ion transport protein [Rhodobacterales bacterium]
MQEPPFAGHQGSRIISLRLRAYRHLERVERSHPTGQIIEIAIILLIAANVVAVILETVPSYHNEHVRFFRWLEVISVAVFTVEYAARLWVAPEAEPDSPPGPVRRRYALSPMALIDLVSILPFYLAFLIPIDLRILRVLRLLRIFKLTRYSSAMSILLEVLRDEARTLFAGIFILFVLLMLVASGAWLAEHRVQPEAFGSIPAAMWWAMATLTTVGYGDVTPITIAGKIFGGLVMLIGVGMAALPAGIFASSFNDHLRHRRDRMRREFEKALADGHIDLHEGRALEELRRQLGISRASAATLYEKARRKTEKAEPIRCTCPHCGQSFEQKVER